VIWDPGPVLFRQVRAGRRGRPFRITKFRTMVVDAEERLRGDPALLASYLAGGNKLRPAQDTRVTRLGRVLRATSLDELPQLFNVLAGSMSLVGPRPVLYSELCHYGTGAALVLAVRPGITGPWQVGGRSSVGRTERVRLDEAYASRWSIGGDLRILARTVVAVARRDGAY
jgi:lipopolysaccharide/colanic/teichoic acid biosynthesis glycosyltransferase